MGSKEVASNFLRREYSDSLAFSKLYLPPALCSPGQMEKSSHHGPLEQLGSGKQSQD